MRHEKTGLDTDQVSRRLGINKDNLAQTDLRTPHATQILFWQVVEEVAGDPDIGMKYSVTNWSERFLALRFQLRSV